jgi:hemolysin III
MVHRAMKDSSALAGRPQSGGEEIANSVSHGLALLAAVAGLPVLIVTAVQRSDAAQVVGVSIFGATVVVLYLASTLYHALPPNRAKRVFYLLDHSAIFLLIAGTYTPFTLGVLRGAWGWTLFGLVWGLAAVGILFKVLGWARNRAISVGLYLVMGWLVLIAAEPLLQVPPRGLAWLVAGGLAYTIGVVFFVLDERVRYAHFVWHLFVVAGTACHFVAVIGYAG